jgi:hypothetical protein
MIVRDAVAAGLGSIVASHVGTEQSLVTETEGER